MFCPQGRTSEHVPAVLGVAMVARHYPVCGTPAVGLMQCAMKPKTENRKPKPTHTCYDDNENATLVPYTMRILRYYAVRRTWLYTYTTVLRSATNVAIVYTYTTVTVLRSETNVAGRWRPGYCLVDISPRGV